MKASDLTPVPQERQWLLDGLWGEQAVGILGGEPKCYKSFLALDMAVAVATGAPCLGHFLVPHPGRALVFAAEDALDIVRRRLVGIAAAAGTTLEQIDLHVITEAVVRLDLERDRKELTATVAALKPRLLVLDPFVRLHRVDENAAAEVAPLLAYLRELQRRFQTAVVLVHHARKGAANARAGQALRGSSELHAWGDSNLYLRRKGERMQLTIEHRAAPGSGGLALALCGGPDKLALRLLEPEPGEEAAESATSLSPLERVTQAMAESSQPLALRELRQTCQMRTASLCAALNEGLATGRFHKSSAGYRLAFPLHPSSRGETETGNS